MISPQQEDTKPHPINCKGCHHIVGRQCVYYTHPKLVKNWPCYFRTNYSKEQAQSTISLVKSLTDGRKRKSAKQQEYKDPNDNRMTNLDQFMEM